MTDQQQPPLWEVMRDAYRSKLRYQESYAAELRAIASEAIKAARAADVDQEARNWFYNWLQNEAKRAEAEE